MDPASREMERIRDRLCSDLIERWQRGERVPVEAYLRQHPALVVSPQATAPPWGGARTIF